MGIAMLRVAVLCARVIRVAVLRPIPVAITLLSPNAARTRAHHARGEQKQRK